MNRITFFTKANCPLCESAWFVIKRLKQRIDFELERVDITEPDNNHWYALYVNHIPVVHLNGQEVFRHHVSERKLRELLISSAESA
jgi:glutaredoxin